MGRREQRIGRFTVDEFRALVSDGRDWLTILDWPPGRAWLFYEGPAGPRGGKPINEIYRAPGKLSIRFGGLESCGQLSDAVTLRITSRSAVPGWPAIRKLSGFERVQPKDRAELRATLVVLGSVLRDESEPKFRELVDKEALDPHAIWARLLDATSIDIGGKR